MWSFEKSKYILIDFGLAEVVMNEVGFKNSTRFVGSYNYCSQEMKRGYFLSSEILVDLYGNDIYGAKKTFQVMKDLL